MPPTLWKVEGGWENRFYLLWQTFLLVTEFSALFENKKC